MLAAWQILAEVSDWCQTPQIRNRKELPCWTPYDPWVMLPLPSKVWPQQKAFTLWAFSSCLGYLPSDQLLSWIKAAKGPNHCFVPRLSKRSGGSHLRSCSTSSQYLWNQCRGEVHWHQAFQWETGWRRCGLQMLADACRCLQFDWATPLDLPVGHFKFSCLDW